MAELTERERLIKVESSIEHLVEIVDGIKTDMRRVAEATSSIPLAMRSLDDTAKSTAAQWVKIDALSKRVDGQDAFKNKVNGAMWALSIALTVIGGSVLGLVSWLFTNTASAEKVNLIQDHRLDLIEKRLDIKPPYESYR